MYSDRGLYRIEPKAAGAYHCDSEGAVIEKVVTSDGTKVFDEACVEYRVFRGKDAEFFLYEDAGDGYEYEQGEYTVTRIFWNEAKEQLLTDKV